MVYKITENEHGDYLNSKQERYEILEATKVATPQGINVGWTECESIEKFAEDNELTYQPIEEEEVKPEIKPDIDEEPEIEDFDLDYMIGEIINE